MNFPYLSKKKKIFEENKGKNSKNKSAFWILLYSIEKREILVKNFEDRYGIQNSLFSKSWNEVVFWELDCFWLTVSSPNKIRNVIYQ